MNIALEKVEWSETIQYPYRTPAMDRFVSPFKTQTPPPLKSAALRAQARQFQLNEASEERERLIFDQQDMNDTRH